MTEYLPKADGEVAGGTLAIRMAYEIPKPKDSGAFQRNCVVLFAEELGDPHTQEYGRNGQKQLGIDILGRRNGDPEQGVAIQCRLITSPLKRKTILADCRAAMSLPHTLKEIIFATTASDDTHATDAAAEVETQLRAEGKNIRVVVYGWGKLQQVIALHDTAYSLFHPASRASSATISVAPRSDDVIRLLSEQSRQLAEIKAAFSPVLLAFSPEPQLKDTDAEDPALHARIDEFRDMFAKETQPRLAERKLLALLDQSDLGTKTWAKFRILTNLGSISIILGREPQAAERYEQAYQIRPDVPQAKSNLALARIFQGKFAEAMALALEALASTPRPENAIAYLLQAAARSDWIGDPRDLVPADLVGSVHADLGISEFIRRRDAPGWELQSMEIARRHLEIPEFKSILAVAVLSLTLSSSSAAPGGFGLTSAADLTEAADAMLASANQMLDVGFEDEHDTIAHLNNASTLLRLCDRNAEVVNLLRRAGTIVRKDAHLRRLMALGLLFTHQSQEAIRYLDGDTDPLNVILVAEILGHDEPIQGLALVSSIDPSGMPEEQSLVCWHAIAGLALAAGNRDELERAVRGLRSIAPGDLAADIFELRDKRRAGLDKEAYGEALQALVHDKSADATIVSRYFLASELLDNDFAEEACNCLDGVVDLRRPTEVAKLYLQSLAASRRDVAFYAALGQASPELRQSPTVLWLAAAHAWNIGDLASAYREVAHLLEIVPDDARARLFKVELLIRQDRVDEVLEELSFPLEGLPFAGLSNRFRIVTLLGNFGFGSRAAALAYRLFLENQDTPKAWMTFACLVLNEGMRKDRPLMWDLPLVALDAAVDVEFDDGTSQSLVIESDRSLRQLDDHSWEPNHVLVRLLMGKAKGERLEEGGRQGTVVNIRHKIVARLHYVLANYERRFPEQQGFRSISIAPGQPGGLDEMLAQLKERHDWIKEEQKQYLAGLWPLGLLAARLHLDTVAVADGMAAQGLKLKVAAGVDEEKEAADRAIRLNRRRGCVLDLYSFWTAWQLETLDVVVAIGGTIHVSRRVLDRLHLMRERLEPFASEGLRQGSYSAGKMLLEETPAHAVQARIANIRGAIAWLETNANVTAVVADGDVHPSLRQYLGMSDIFDSLVLAMTAKLLLVTDDLPTRQLGQSLGYKNSCWSQALLTRARDRRLANTASYLRWTAALVSAGHDYIGLSGADLLCALLLDVEDGQALGGLFCTLAQTIGGKSAEPISHLKVVLGFMQPLWASSKTVLFRRQATSFLLEQLVRDRHDDYIPMLRTIYNNVRIGSQLQQFVLYWLRGHFFPLEMLHASKQ